VSRFNNSNGRPRGNDRAPVRQQQQEDDQQYHEETHENSGGRNPPVQTLVIGRMRLVIWANKDKDGGVWHSISLSRSYKDGEGNWKQAQTYGRDDCLVGAELLRLALHKIVELEGGR